jgi:hypothetical protein
MPLQGPRPMKIDDSPFEGGAGGCLGGMTQRHRVKSYQDFTLAAAAPSRGDSQQRIGLPSTEPMLLLNVLSIF